MKNLKKCLILIPTYNDWIALNKLIKEIDFIIKSEQRIFEIIIVNDASTIQKFVDRKSLKKINKIDIINLKKNSGSQIAIAVGLNFIKMKDSDSDLVILDSDGEDDPKEILNLLKELDKNKEKVIVARRIKRKENAFLRVINILRLYFTYFLTGHMINFGNFSSLNSSQLNKIFSKKELNLSYSATIQKFLKIKKIPIEKQNRYYGKSKVSLSFLILYSFQIISVFLKRVFLRSSIMILFLICFNYLLVNDMRIIFLIFVIFILNINLFILNYFSRKTNFLNLINK